MVRVEISCESQTFQLRQVGQGYLALYSVRKDPAGKLNSYQPEANLDGAINALHG